ncbi:DUF5684 domain-containing protein [Chloroflexota bacterium]
MQFLWSLLAYVWLALCLFIIANKTNTRNAVLAWIPIANLYLMCKIARKPGWWTILYFIPLLNLVVLVVVWMEIAKARNQSSWVGILIIIPGANVIVPGILAFAD